MKKYRICAVVVTYNRKELLLRNIKSLLKQTYPLDILIYDNASTDGTPEYLSNEGVFDKNNVYYIKGEKNGGGSYGFCHGEEVAYNRGYDYLWLMDDDGYCINDFVLQELVNQIDEKDNKIIYNSYVIRSSDSKEPTFTLGTMKTYKEIYENSINQKVIGEGNPYNGTLVPSICFKEIGFTDERFFIYGDENDYFLRSKKAGYQWITVLTSLYFHPVNRTIIKEFNMFGYSFDAKDQPVWKLYLEVRNGMYIRMKYDNKKMSLKYLVKIILVCLYSKDKKIKRFKYCLLALGDGFKGDFERTIPFEV